ncbi:hypothetical protein B0G76_4292 [Paraburkholderia sp. BL23I1N1]|nr:hypothetical protein B0G76_4292 [Paraburkholderia sp. BL23I1N1]
MGPHLFLAQGPRLSVAEIRIADRLAPQYFCRHHAKPHDTPPVTWNSRPCLADVAHVGALNDKPQYTRSRPAQAKKHFIFDGLAEMRNAFDHEPVRIACEVAMPRAQLRNDCRKSERPMMSVKAECASDVPVVGNPALITKHVEIQPLTGPWPERHAMRRVFDMDGRRRGRKLRRSGNGKRERAGEQVRQAITDACHVDMTLPQN